MTVYSSFGKICQLTDNEKGYTAVVIATQIPWKTVYKKFNVWNKAKLLNNGEQFKLEDEVRITYVDSKFPKLKEIESVMLDSCAVCFSFYEVENAQRMDCGFCSVYDEEKRDRVNTTLKLISNKTKTYTYSDGCCLTFVDEDTDTTYFTCVFENSPFYSDLTHLETKTYYRVLGWVAKKTDDENFFIDLVDIPDIDNVM